MLVVYTRVSTQEQTPRTHQDQLIHSLLLPPRLSHRAYGSR